MLPPPNAGFVFGLIGDLPYDATEEAKLPALTADMNRAPLAFSIFDGDIKSGGTACDDASFVTAQRWFDSFAAPLVYVPGDNEWTDCHRRSCGGYDAIERLDHLRKVMFQSGQSFGQKRLALSSPDAHYPENTRFRYGDIVFAGLNVPGSNNNKVTRMALDERSARSLADLQKTNAEYEQRDAANGAFLRDSFRHAKESGARGLVVVIQADAMPEVTEASERVRLSVDGYDAFLETFRSEAIAFGRPTVLVHGDSHYFKVDKPFRYPSTRNVVENVTRVETFGSPNVFWVKATVDPSDPNLFRFEPQLVRENYAARAARTDRPTEPKTVPAGIKGEP
jgi:hypothetical protein